MKRESALIHFEMYQVHDSPGTTTWIEKWSEPVEWIMKHQMTKDYYHDYDATEPFYVAPRELRVLTPELTGASLYIPKDVDELQSHEEKPLAMSDYPIRPPTPQAMLHRLPDKPDGPRESTRPSKYIILIIASTSVAGKVQIAKSVAAGLSCPLFQGDSLHETSAKAASVGATKGPFGGHDDDPRESGPNEARYQRMWLSKMTRTGLLFPDESRPANEGFSGFGGSASTSTSRRGSASSIASASSFSDAAGSTSSSARSFVPSGAPTSKYINKPPAAALSENEMLRRANPALMVVTHPELQQWHKDSIRKTVGEYGIGIIFVPLYQDEDGDEEDLPVLKPLDPRTMTSFASLASFDTPRAATLEEETILKVNVDGKVEDIIDEIVERAGRLMNA